MSDDIEKYSEAILQVVYNDENDYIWIKGSAFVVSVKEKLFVVTASHCIYDENIKDLFFSKMSTQRNCYCLPITHQVKSYDSKERRCDTDLRVFKVDDEEYFKNIMENSGVENLREYSAELIKTPLFHKLKRIYKNHPDKLLRKLKASKLYNTLTDKRNEKIKQKIENSDTSLAEIKNLNLADSFEYKKRQDCSFAGYSTVKGNMEFDDYGFLTHGHQYLMVLHGELTGDFYENSQTYALSYETDNDLDGISGGPVWADKKVIGVCSFIEEKKKLLHFIPVSEVKRSIDFWFNEQNKL